VSGEHEPNESDPTPVTPEPGPDDSPFVPPPMDTVERGREQDPERRERA
jgi:hypothetical protein